MQLHTEIDSKEEKIASGVYIHSLEGLASGTNETWQLHHLAETEILRVHFTTEAYMILATVHRNAGRVTRLQYELKADRRATGDYQIQGDQMHIERSIGTSTRLKETIPWSGANIFDLPFLCCKGAAILRLAQDNSVPTFAPHLQLAERAGDLAKKQAEFVGDDDHGRHYRYGRDYWLDDHDTVVRATDDSMDMDYLIELTEYEREA